MVDSEDIVEIRARENLQRNLETLGYNRRISLTEKDLPKTLAHLTEQRKRGFFKDYIVIPLSEISEKETVGLYEILLKD